MTTINPSGPDADDLAARARANATLSRIMEAAPAGTPDAERLALATTAYGQSVATSANRLARQRLLTAYSRPQDGPLGDIQAVDLLGACPVERLALLRLLAARQAHMQRLVDAIAAALGLAP